MPVLGIRAPIGRSLAAKVAAKVMADFTPDWHPSPNFGPRRGVDGPDMVVIHYTAMETAEAALERLCAPEHEVSAHYLIAEDGRAWQLVRDVDRAWHAGRGCWGRVTDVNSHSIGIELANIGTHPFAEPQLIALEQLLSACMQRWPIPPERVIGHQDMAPARKQDPGGRFDWRRLSLLGLSVWPTAGDRVGDFSDDAARFGYGEVGDSLVLDAFRARFRPMATGPLDDHDRAMIHDLARRFPVDGGAALP